MTKATMPEPVAYAVTNKRHQEFSIALHHDASFAESDNDFLIEDLITTTQAEAYANAMVRVALEESIIEVMRCKTSGIIRNNTVDKCADAIRALIPATK